MNVSLLTVVVVGFPDKKYKSSQKSSKIEVL